MDIFYKSKAKDENKDISQKKSFW